MSHTKTLERFREPLSSALREQATCLRSQKPEALRDASSKKIMAITQTVKNWVGNVCQDVADRTTEQPSFSHACTSRYGAMRNARALGVRNTEHFLQLAIMGKLTEKIEALTQTELPDDDAE